MRFLILIFLGFMASFAFADDNCKTNFGIKLPLKHQIIGCSVKANANNHFNKFNFARQAEPFKITGQLHKMQLKYTGDWLIKPSFYQLSRYYLAQIQKFNGKLLFEDKTSVTYKYYDHQNTYWISLRDIGKNIHGLKIMFKKGIIKEAEYNIGQLKSQLSRYGKAAFHNITADKNGQFVISSSASLKMLSGYLKLKSDSKFYIVIHVQTNNVFEVDYNRSITLAKNLEQTLLTDGVVTQNIIVKGIGPLSPIKNVKRFMPNTKNNRIMLIARPQKQKQ